MLRSSWLSALVLTSLAPVLAACGAKVSAGGAALFDREGDAGTSAPPSATAVMPESTTGALTFAIVGDTRPADVDDTAGYPMAIIDAIFSGIARESAAAFVVATGDYEFASPAGREALPQLELYMQARAKFPGPLLPAMGNHECTGATASNCGLGNKDGFPANYSAFLEEMLRPIHQALPYYVARIAAADASWSAKLVFIAANAWDSTQARWLEAALSVPTTYTFVVRHEPNEARSAPGTVPSEAIVVQHPLTLEICGHVHSYSHHENRIVIGNGGAPLAGAKGYGYAIVDRQADGVLFVDEIDYLTGQADPAFHFAVTPDGLIVKEPKRGS